MLQRLEQTSRQTEARDDATPKTLAAIPKFGLTGSGAGSYYTTIPQYNDDNWCGFYDLAHNDFLQSPLEFGVPVSALLALMVWTGRRFRRCAYGVTC